MGFLNNTTVTVDAILTKKGRELLAQGTQAFNITKFALADDEVDYGLWDTTHPNGSDYYGAVIENMPLLEATPDENHVMRYKLLTLDKGTTKLPVISISPGSFTFNKVDKLSQSQTITINPTQGPVDTSYSFILNDNTVASMTVVTPGPGGNAASTPFFNDVSSATASTTIVAVSVKIEVLAQESENSAQLVVYGNDTGATSAITITNNLTHADL